MSANWLYSAKRSNDLIFQIVDLETKWQEEFSPEQILSTLSLYIDELSGMSDGTSAPEQLYKALDFLYDDLAFSGSGLQFLPESSLSNLSYCIMHRTGNDMSLSILLQYLLSEVGFDAYLAESESGLVLAVKLSNSELCIVDPITGGSEYLISNDDVKSTLTNEVAAFAKPIDQEELLKEVLTEQKVACLEEGFLHQAFEIVETLMELLPEDPYERRDRGLVLSQLDCEKWAKEDLDYFIQACPNDPMAMFLRAQLDEQGNSFQTIH
jgi:regulator of sirC expression with transglutaminase-like and TPR domain